jgi:hypothetical protein
MDLGCQAASVLQRHTTTSLVSLVLLAHPLSRPWMPASVLEPEYRLDKVLQYLWSWVYREMCQTQECNSRSDIRASVDV